MFPEMKPFVTHSCADKSRGFFHCPDYGSAGKQAMLAREEKQRGFRRRDGDGQ
jgi:hypothetical protein